MKTTRSLTHVSLILLICLLLNLPSTLFSAEAKPDENNEEQVAATEEEKTTLINLYSWASILPKELIDLQNRISKQKKIKAVQDELPEIAKDIEQIRWDTTIAKTTPDLQIHLVTNLQNNTQKTASRLKKISKPINTAISFWSDARKQWLNKKKQIDIVGENEEIPLILETEQHDKLLATINEAVLIIEEHLKVVLIIGKEIGDLQILLYSIDGDLQSLDEELKATSMQQTAPSMLSSEFYSRINLNLITQSYRQTKHFFSGRIKSLKQNPRYLIFSCIGFVVICFVISKSKLFIHSTSKWQPFTKRPVASTIFMGSVVNAFANVFPLRADLPEQWEALFHIITLIAVTRLTG